MTVPHVVEPLPAASVAAAANALRSRGLRVSAARRLVLEALFAADRPVSAEEIAGGLDGRLPTSDLGSTYRNLETLEEVGLVRHVHLGHGPGLYAVGDREYALCEGCHAVRALGPDEAEALRVAVASACGYEARFSHFPLIGRCPECAAFLRTARDEF